MAKATVIDKKDNVVVLLSEAKTGESIIWNIEGNIEETVAKNDIPPFHKIANKPIKRGEAIVKYGEHIGLAAADIDIGEHVHTHNVLDNRESL